jgi:hypothetical protein
VRIQLRLQLEATPRAPTYTGEPAPDDVLLLIRKALAFAKSRHAGLAVCRPVPAESPFTRDRERHIRRSAAGETIGIA